MSLAANRQGEEGFALVAALGALLLFALFAYTVLAADRGTLADVDAQIRRAKLEAAADAGLATAIEGLGAAPAHRWPIDGHSRSLNLDDMDISASVEDERGKVNLNGMTEDEARRLFQGAGVTGARLNQLTDDLMDWLDGGERPNGAKVLDYAAHGERPRRGPMRTLGELMAIRGMDSAVYDRIAPVLTVFFGDAGAFEPGAASPLAIRVMALNTTPPPLRPTPGADYIGRPFAVRIVVKDAQDGRVERTTIVELTGQPRHPVWIRAIGDGRQPGDP